MTENTFSVKVSDRALALLVHRGLRAI